MVSGAQHLAKRISPWKVTHSHAVKTIVGSTQSRLDFESVRDVIPFIYFSARRRSGSNILLFMSIFWKN